MRVQPCSVRASVGFGWLWMLVIADVQVCLDCLFLTSSVIWTGPRCGGSDAEMRGAEGPDRALPDAGEAVLLARDPPGGQDEGTTVLVASFGWLRILGFRLFQPVRVLFFNGLRGSGWAASGIVSGFGIGMSICGAMSMADALGGVGPVDFVATGLVLGIGEWHFNRVLLKKAGVKIGTPHRVR